MALGKRLRERQLEDSVSASDVPQSRGYRFREAYNNLLADPLNHP